MVKKAGFFLYPSLTITKLKTWASQLILYQRINLAAKRILEPWSQTIVGMLAVVL